MYGVGLAVVHNVFWNGGDTRRGPPVSSAAGCGGGHGAVSPVPRVPLRWDASSSPQEDPMTTLSTAPPTSPPDRAPSLLLLQTQRADCVRQRELALAETATSMPDPVAQSRAAGLLHVIEEIDAALQRIATGTYGACVYCGGAIPAERLEFRPFAAGCVSCQQAR